MEWSKTPLDMQFHHKHRKGPLSVNMRGSPRRITDVDFYRAGKITIREKVVLLWEEKVFSFDKRCLRDCFKLS